MFAYIARRIVYVIPIVLSVALVCFLLVHITPGDPLVAVLPLLERARGRLADVFATFGRVPLVYYLLHIPLIHVTALAVWYLRDGSTHAEWFAIAPFVEVPPDQPWGLPLLYLVFAIDVTVLYGACRWFAYGRPVPASDQKVMRSVTPNVRGSPG